MAFAGPAFAGPFEDAVGKFASDDYSDTEEAIAGVASSGNPLAYPIINALKDERLMADPETKKVYIKQLDGKAIDAATGAAVDTIPDSASAVNMNNRLRRTGDAALGGLTLLSPDPATRLMMQVTLDDAATADELFSVLMGEDVESRRSFITRNAKDVRFLDV